MKKTSPNQELGSSIILVVSVLATLMVIVGVALEYTTTLSRNVQRSTTLETTVAVANGVLDNNYAYWRAQCRTRPNRAMNSFDLRNLPVPGAAQFPDIPNFSATAADYDANRAITVQQCKTIAVDPALNPIDPTGSDPLAVPIPGIGPTQGGVGNANTTATYNYLSTAYVTLPAIRGNLVAKVQRVFQKDGLSPWNYAIFYVDPLEIHPGPDFNVTGAVHTNSDLYTASSTLHFLDKATFSGTWEVNYHRQDRRRVDPPTFAPPSWPAGLPPQQDDTHQPFGINPSEVFNTVDTNPNNDGYHELIEPPVSPSKVGNEDPLAGARYYDQAGVIIEVDASNVVTIMKGNGDGTATVLTGSSSGNDKKLYDMFNGAVSTNESIIDNREGTNTSVRVASLDVSKITQSSKGGVNGVRWKSYDPITGADPFNGIVYIHDTSAAPNGVGAKRGIRLQNGKLIPKDGLTVASGNPVYLQGDYNTGNNPPSNTGDPTRPEGAGYSRQPCAVVADAVNILSNAYTGAAFGNASNTTINTAIVSGIVPTANGDYSGGAENFPRFLESWGGQSLTYYGSMVELYNSKQAIGKWTYGNPIYTAPNRLWYFDNNFRLNSPPGSLMTYTYRKGQWALVP